MIADDKKLEDRLKVLLKQNPHEKERYLACCTLLIRMQPSRIRTIVDQHSDFRNYIINLIRTAADISLEMRRIGIRIISMYLPKVNRAHEGSLVEIKDWNMLIGIFVKRCEDNEAIEVFDGELLHLIRIGLEGSYINIVTSNILLALPDLMMERFCNGSNDKSGTKTDTSAQEIGMAFILRKVLDGNDEKDSAPCDNFCEAMIQYLAFFAGYLNSSDNSVQNSSILTCAFVKRSTSLLFAQNKKAPLITSHEYRSLLHYTLLVFISRNLAHDQTREKSFSLQQTLAKAEDETLNASIQKLILSGITSLLDSVGRNNAEHTNGELEEESTLDVNIMIRTMTIQLLADLMESGDIKWMKSSSQEGSLGDAGTLCMMTRLVAGELRIVLGGLVDRSLILNDPDNDGKTNTAPKLDEGISQRCQACIQIGLFTLKSMLELAIEQDSGERQLQYRPALPFNADSILHIRHTLEDYLDTCIQFLLEDINADAFEGWPECAFETCRYFGAYLTQVSVFDYDFLDSNDDEQDNDEGDRKQTTTVNLIRAMSNGLAICLNLSKNLNGKQGRNFTLAGKAVTLFPSVLSTLTCCEDSRQTMLLRKYLFRNTLVSSSIVNILNNIVITGGGIVNSLYANLDSISWSCLLIDAMLDFESMSYTQSATKIMNKESLIKGLTLVSKYMLDVGEESMISSEGNEILNTLAQLFDCWVHLASVERTGCEGYNPEMLRVRSFLEVNSMIEM